MDLITYDNAHKVKDILLNGNFDNKSINLEFKNINAKVYINGLTEVEKSEIFIYEDMDMFWFINSLNEEDTYGCIDINGHKEELYMNIGSWGDNKYNIKNMHLVLGTTTHKFGSAKEYFSQIEISQALEDENYIYIVKNITDLAGKGCISRINTGLKNDKDKKYERRTRLVNRLNSQVLVHNTKDWMVISKINKEDLQNNDKFNSICYKLIKDIINYSFTIEDIIAEDKLK